MILTITLNPAIDKILILERFDLHKLHRLKSDELTMTLPGGKGVNIALNLKFLGNEVIATGFAGGHAGHLLCDGLRQKDITTSFVFTGDSTRTNISILDLTNETLTEVNDFGQEVSTEDIDYFIENYTRLLNRVDYVIIAGSVPKGVPDDIYKSLIKMALKKELKVFFHVSPEHLDAVFKASPFLINPDMRSNHQLFGKPLDGIEQFVEAGRDILVKSRDTEFVLFTHRIENVVAVTRDKSYILRPKELKIVNMLGYADAFIAGFIHAFKQNLPTSEILKYASSAGLTNVENIYKELTDTDKITENLQRIEVEEIT
jgi:1-phosphofructokinase family hexose kinase